MATTDTYFISSQYLKDNSIMNNNVDDELIDPFILVGQNVHVEKVVGTGIYNDIISGITNGTISGNTKVLLDDYITPHLVQAVLYESLPFINFKFTNKSIAKKDSENSTPAELDELIYLRNNISDVMQYMAQRTTNYLIENSESFPLYYNPGTGSDIIRPNNSSYFEGLYLGDGGRGNCDYGTLDNTIPLN